MALLRAKEIAQIYRSLWGIRVKAVRGMRGIPAKTAITSSALIYMYRVKQDSIGRFG